MLPLIVATRNPDKVRELKKLLSRLNLSVHSLLDFPSIPSVVEDRDSIAGNAMKKALFGAKETGMLCLADDTGLFIEALDDAPGVYSARYAGTNCSYLDNRRKVLIQMEGQTNRAAHFDTAIALANEEGIIAIVSASVRGMICEFERGTQGFGYDNLFEPEGLCKTYAELSEEEKNLYSHRSLAIKKILPVLERIVHNCN
jgi:XTP/dITP diphosphohydrolase